MTSQPEVTGSPNEQTSPHSQFKHAQEHRSSLGARFSQSPSRTRTRSLTHDHRSERRNSYGRHQRGSAPANEPFSTNEGVSSLYITERPPDSPTNSQSSSRKRRIILAPADSTTSSVSDSIKEERSGKGPRRQEGAQNYASNMSLPEFRKKKHKFKWPQSSDDMLILEAGKGFPLDWKSNVGKSDTAIISAHVTKKENGFEDTVAVKEIRVNNEIEKRKVEGEIETLKTLSHNHCITYLGCSTYEKNFQILMFPVASYNLKTFMAMISDHNSKANFLDSPKEHEHVGILWNFFPCLCQALLYLHEHLRIKHKDIKPENILVDKWDNVILTDFGISTRHAGSANPVTIGPTGCTVMYAAREAINEGARDFDIDIFSLGCVFLEMMTVICGETIENLCNFVGKPVKTGTSKPNHLEGSKNIEVTYYNCADKVSAWVEYLKNLRDRKKIPSRAPFSTLTTSQQDTKSTEQVDVDNDFLSIILRMMSDSPKARPRLREVWSVFDATALPCKNCHPTLPGTEWEGNHVPNLGPSQLPINTESPGRIPSPTDVAFKFTRAETGDKISPSDAQGMNQTSIYDFDNEFEGFSKASSLGLLNFGPGRREMMPPVPSRTMTPSHQRHKSAPFFDYLTPTSLTPRMRPVAPAPQDGHLFHKPVLNSQDTTPVGSSDVSVAATLTPNSNEPATTDAPQVNGVSDRTISNGFASTNPPLHIRIFAPGPRPSLKTVPAMEYIVREQILVFEDGEVQPFRKADLHKEMLNGVFMKMPRGNVWKWRTVKGVLNLWSLVPFKWNMRRTFERNHMMFFKGNFPDNELLSWTDD